MLAKGQFHRLDGSDSQRKGRRIFFVSKNRNIKVTNCFYNISWSWGASPEPAPWRSATASQALCAFPPLFAICRLSPSLMLPEHWNNNPKKAILSLNQFLFSLLFFFPLPNYNSLSYSVTIVNEAKCLGFESLIII